MNDVANSYSSLIELLQFRAFQQPERLAYTFLQEDGTEQSYTYLEMDRKARQLAALLQTQHRVGERALLLYQPGLAYLTAFFGCLYAGVVPVPAYPPRLNGNLGRLQSILQDAEATIALTSDAILTGLERRFADAAWLNRSVHWIVTDVLEDGLEELWKQPLVGREELAFLQYTSGSTALPKGVMLSHGNLLHNLELIQSCFGTHADSKCVIWLPPYHDMGLIGGILQPLYTGYPVTLMAPVDFIQRPVRWLETISRVGASVSGGPNFAYDLCVQKVTAEQRKQLDLSTWETAFTGAEPVRSETLERFVKTFAECGFRKEAFYPCYGLAEGTLFVTGGWKQEEPIVRSFHGEALKLNQAVKVETADEGDRTLVSSGRLSLVQQQVVVVDTETRTALPDERVGEIWVHGPSVAQGYWKREEQTEETFQARLASGEGLFLRTGDLGFVCDGELFVTGRLKDLVIIRGRNYYPTDLEVSMQESHVAVRNTNGAAFTVEVDGDERLVVVQEVERAHRKTDPKAIVTAIRKAISEEHQLQVHAVVLLKPASIPKTSSGKIQRHACRNGFMEGTLEVLHSDMLGETHQEFSTSEMQETQAVGVVEQVTELERKQLLAMDARTRQEVLTQYLCGVVARLLRCALGSFDAQQSLHGLGIDSMQAVELKHELEDRLQVVLPFARLLDGPSVAELAREVEEQLHEGNEQSGTSERIDAQVGRSHLANRLHVSQQGDVDEIETSACREFPLSHGQKALWFLHRLDPQSAAYN
ncbi:MAG: AMP-binding protein, partial [Tumebacillaceae bacterium]